MRGYLVRGSLITLALFMSLILFPAMALAADAGTTTGIKTEAKDGNNELSLGVGPYFSDGALGFDPSVEVRIRYILPIVMLSQYFSLMPYIAGGAVPDLNEGKQRPYDFNGSYQARIRGGYILAATVGLIHVSNLAKWGIAPAGMNVYGDLFLGLGITHYVLNVQRLSSPTSPFKIADRFDSNDGAFTSEIVAGVKAEYNRFLFGVNGRVAPNYTDLLNGQNKWRVNGAILFFLGYQFELF